MKKRIKNTDLNRLSGVSIQQISYIINGKHGTTKKTAEKLSIACLKLGVKISPMMWEYADRNKLKKLLGRGE